MHSSALLGWFGAALSMTLPWPQVWRSVAQGRTKGLSATACWQGVAMPVGWITYGLLTGQTVQIVTNTVTGLTGLSILVMVLVKQSELRTMRNLLISAAGAAGVLSAAVGSVAVAALTDIGSARASAFLGSVLAIVAMLSAVPQPLSLLRNRNQDLAGLSPLRWRLAAGACASWFLYGLTTGQTAVWLSAMVGLASALIVCWVLYAAGRTRATAPIVARGTATVSRPARGTARVVRPAFATPAVTSAAPRVVRAASAVSRTPRPVSGPVAPVRPARVPWSSDRPTLIMHREPALV